MAIKAGVYRGVTAADRAADRRERLFEATLEVWGRDGGPSVTMTRICAEAGLTERYFYENFSGLNQALLAVLDRIAAEIAERSVTAIESTAGDSTDRVRAAIAAFVQILTDDPRKGRVAIVESTSLDVLRRRRNELLRQFANLAAFEARELYGAKAWNKAEGEMVGLLFVGGLAELVRAWIDDEIDASPNDIVEAATHHFTATAHR
ncbi:MAG: TetR/AcrR family transcriptional regulator [Aeromicrobium sp.]